MSQADRLALLLSLCAFGAALVFGSLVFENIPHIEDEFTYVWQAQAIAAGGNAIVPSPPFSSSFIVPFVIDFNGQRFGKYPLGFPVVLSLGVKLGARCLINPLLAGFSLWLMYLLIKKVLGGPSALLAGGLTLISPFFLMNSSNLLSHAWSLFLAVGMSLAWLDAIDERSPHTWLAAVVSAFCLGALALTRPLTAVGVGLPFAVHGMLLLRRASRSLRLRLVLIVILSGLFASIHFLWQFALTGDALLNPYTLWWETDTLGFGTGVGFQPGGYFLKDAFVNMFKSLSSGASDLFGWQWLSWLFLPFGILAIRKNPRAVLIASVFFSLVFVYGFYWSGSWLFGPRYYYEGLFSLTLLSTAGVRWLAGKKPAHLKWRAMFTASNRRYVFVWALTALLAVINLFVYLPSRAAGLRGLYGVSRANLQPFLTSQVQASTPILVLVRGTNWNIYYNLLELSNANLNSPILVAYSHGKAFDASLIAAYPNRAILYYDSDHPGELNTSPP